MLYQALDDYYLLLLCDNGGTKVASVHDLNKNCKTRLDKLECFDRGSAVAIIHLGLSLTFGLGYLETFLELFTSSNVLVIISRETLRPRSSIGCVSLDSC